MSPTQRIAERFLISNLLHDLLGRDAKSEVPRGNPAAPAPLSPSRHLTPTSSPDESPTVVTFAGSLPSQAIPHNQCCGDYADKFCRSIGNDAR